jgi:hypothetical protein
MRTLSEYVGTFLQNDIRREFNFCELERTGLESFVQAQGDTVTAFKTDKGSTRVETRGGYTVSMNGYVCVTRRRDL